MRASKAGRLMLKHCPPVAKDTFDYRELERQTEERWKFYQRERRRERRSRFLRVELPLAVTAALCAAGIYWVLTGK